MKLIISHTRATYVMEDIVILRGNCLSVTFLEKKKKQVSASAPGSHCYATQQLDIQVNRSSTSVGGRKNAKNPDAYPPGTHLKRVRNKPGASEKLIL